MAHDTKQLECTIHGNVQGVFFRANARQNAMQLGITGWAANEPDGSVRVVAQGDEGRLHAFLDFLKVGPPSAEVESVDVTWSDPDETYDDFEIR